MSAALKTMSPEWHEWILTNLERGCTHASILDALEKTWSRLEALSALNAALNTLNNPALNRPLIDTSANYISLADRTVQILFTLKNPHIVLIDNVLSHSECDDLVQCAYQKGLLDSSVVDYQTGASVAHQARTSSGTSFSRAENRIVAALENRLSALNNWPMTHAEGIQVLQYTNGQEYKPHHDYFEPSKPGSASHLIRGGQRVGTY